MGTRRARAATIEDHDMIERTGVRREVAAARIEPGPGFVARAGNLVVWAEPDPDEAGSHSLDTVVTGMGDIAGRVLPGEQAMTLVSALLNDVRAGALAGLAAVVPTESGLVAISRGWGVVHGSGSGDEEASDGEESGIPGSGASGGPRIRMVELTDEVLIVGRRDVTGRLARDLSRPSPPGRTLAGPTPTTEGLVEGLVPGGAVTLETRISIAEVAGEDVPGPPAVPPPEVEPPVAAAEPVDPGDGDEVLIEGIECLRGHLNNPLALVCGTCGISMIQHSSTRVEGVRPSLGVIVLDDGTAYSLTTDLILGSAPDLADAVAAGRARGVQVVDPTDGIEPLHTELRLMGWDVTVIDWSTRGTFLLPEDATTWQVAPRGAPTALAFGTRIAIGSRTLLFDSRARLS